MNLSATRPCLLLQRRRRQHSDRVVASGEKDVTVMCRLRGRDSTLPVDSRHRFGEAGSQRIVIGDRMVLDDASTHLNALVC